MGDFLKIRRECLSKGQLFEDPEFPCVDSNLFYHRKPPMSFDWKRPTELCEKPKFVVDNPDLYDVVAGSLGDQWFVSTVGILYQYRGLFYRAVPADQGFSQEFEYTGIFHFRFWWAGEWTEVLVDDRLPVDRLTGKLVFVHSQSSNQFWMALLEKAYAKLHGSYEALKYTSSVDVFNELTGGTTEKVSVFPEDSCLKLLCKSIKVTSITSAVSDPEKQLTNGIIPGMNYSISAVEHIQTSQGSIPMICLRVSPGVNKIYTGPYSSAKSPEWKKISSEERERLSIDEADALRFWMAWNDFIRTFSGIEIVYLDEDTCQSELRFRQGHMKPPISKSYQGFWKKGATAGGCRNHPETFHINPQLMLSVSQTDEFCIDLIQHQINEPKVVGFSIYQAPQQSNTGIQAPFPTTFFQTVKALTHSQYSNARQVLHRLQLQPGKYVIVVTTYDAGQEGTFTVRVLAQSSFGLNLLDCVPCLTRPAVIRSNDGLDDYKTMFSSMADERKTINAYELQELLHAVLPNDYMKSCASLDVCRKVVKAFGINQQLGRINYQQFKDFITSLKIWQEIFEIYSKSTSGVLKAELLRQALADVGFQVSTDIAHLILLHYMRRDGTLRFGDFVACTLQLIASFSTFARKDPNQTGAIKLNSCDWLKAVLRC